MVAASKSSSRSSQDNIIGEGDDGGEGLGDAGDMDVASLWAELAQDSDLPVGPMIVEEKKRQNQSRQVRSVVTDDDGNDDGVARVQWPEFLDSDENDDDVDDMDDVDDDMDNDNMDELDRSDLDLCSVTNCP